MVLLNRKIGQGFHFLWKTSRYKRTLWHTKRRISCRSARLITNSEKIGL